MQRAGQKILLFVGFAIDFLIVQTTFLINDGQDVVSKLGSAARRLAMLSTSLAIAKVQERASE